VLQRTARSHTHCRICEGSRILGHVHWRKASTPRLIKLRLKSMLDRLQCLTAYRFEVERRHWDSPRLAFFVSHTRFNCGCNSRLRRCALISPIRKAELNFSSCELHLLQCKATVVAEWRFVLGKSQVQTTDLMKANRTVPHGFIQSHQEHVRLESYISQLLLSST
jgi:hypothetical protein